MNDDVFFGIKNKYLTPIHCERINIHYDLSNVNVRNGDYVIKGLSKAINIDIVSSKGRDNCIPTKVMIIANKVIPRDGTITAIII